MKRYIVYLTENGATSPIDNITADESYTPEQYRKDCESNGVEWPEGEITFEETEA